MVLWFKNTKPLIVTVMEDLRAVSTVVNFLPSVMPVTSAKNKNVTVACLMFASEVYVANWFSSLVRPGR